MTRADFGSLLALARSDAGDTHLTDFDQQRAIAAVERLAASTGLRDQPLVPLVCRGARRLGILSELSAPAREALERVRHEAVARALHQRRWLTEAIGDLGRCGIACVLLKGAAFNGALYPDDAPRLGGDVDLLVAPAAFDVAYEALGRRARPAGPRPDRRATHAVTYEKQLLIDGPFAMLVELHRALTVPHVFTIDTDALVERSVPHPAYERGSARMLDPEDTLLHLAVHSFRHLRLETHALLDAHEAYTRWRPDPNELARRAAAWGARTALYLLLDAARELVGTTIPASLLDRLAPGVARGRLGREVYRFATERRLGMTHAAYRPVQLVSFAAVPDRLSGVLRYLATYAVRRVGDWWATGRESG
jgi:hypothetical protein